MDDGVAGQTTSPGFSKNSGKCQLIPSRDVGSEGPISKTVNGVGRVSLGVEKGKNNALLNGFLTGRNSGISGNRTKTPREAEKTSKNRKKDVKGR